jgi:signal transduction histidine kinase/ActR/RegA family two-component response regulator
VPYSHPVEDRASPETVAVLFAGDAWSDAATDLLQAAANARGVTVSVQRSDRDLRDTIAAARAADRNAALLYVAPDEEDVLAAIEAGADEAVTLPSCDLAAIDRLLSRTLTRARTRLYNEQIYGSAAHAEKLSALGTLVAGVAHEINNPCSALTLSLEVVKYRLAPLFEIAKSAPVPEEHRAALRAALDRADMRRFLPDLSSTFDDMMRATEAISAIVGDLRLFARSDEQEPAQHVDLHALLDQVLRIAGPRIAHVAHVERDYDPSVTHASVPRSRLAQVLTNILVNAAQAMADVERPMHRLRISTRADAEGLVISISDTGPGIPPEQLERIFDPFFTTKKAGEGTGLGLALSSDLVRRMGGQILVESDYGHGATFLIYLPLGKPATPSSQPAQASWAPSSYGRRAVILAVDDDERVLRAYARALRDRYDVLLATDGQEAIDLLSSGSHADAILTDMQMTDVGGRELLRWLETQRPELVKKLVIATAIPLAEEDERRLRLVCGSVLYKPVSYDALLACFRDLLRNEKELAA